MNPLAAYPMAITAASLVPVIMWLGDWPLKSPSQAVASSIAVLIVGLTGSVHAWLGGHLVPDLDKLADQLAEYLRQRVNTRTPVDPPPAHRVQR